MSLIYGNYFQQPILNEVAVYSSRKSNFCIMVDGNGKTDRGYGNDPYFKIYNHQNRTKATKCARISLLEPRYIIHNNEKWNLNSKELKTMIDCLSSVSGNGTVWDDIKSAAAKEAVTNMDEKEAKALSSKLLSLKCPDYKKLK